MDNNAFVELFSLGKQELYIVIAFIKNCHSDELTSQSALPFLESVQQS